MSIETIRARLDAANMMTASHVPVPPDDLAALLEVAEAAKGTAQLNVRLRTAITELERMA